MGNKHSHLSKLDDNGNPAIVSSFSNEYRTFFPSLKEIPHSCQANSELDPKSLQRRKSPSSNILFCPSNEGPFEARTLEHQIKGKKPTKSKNQGSCSDSYVTAVNTETAFQNTFAPSRQPLSPQQSAHLVSRPVDQPDFLSSGQPFYPPLQLPAFCPNPAMQIPPHLHINETKTEKRKHKKQKKEMKKRGMNVDLFSDLPFGAMFTAPWRLSGAPVFTPDTAPFSNSCKARSMENLYTGSMSPLHFPPYPPFWGPVCFRGREPNRHPSFNGLRTSANAEYLASEHLRKNVGKRILKDKQQVSCSADQLSLKSIETRSSTRESILFPFSHSKKCKRGQSQNKKVTEESTRFKEERVEVDPGEVNEQTSGPASEAVALVDVRRKTPPPDVIYETLKAARRSKLLTTTADVQLVDNYRKTKENFLNLSHEKTQGLSTEKTLPTKHAHEQNPITVDGQVADKVDSNVKLKSTKNTEGGSISSEPAENQFNGCEVEQFIEATIAPYLPRRKVPQPANSDPLNSWCSLNQMSRLNTLRSQYNEAHNGLNVEEQLSVKLVVVPPAKQTSIMNAEPIYLEYEQRLPEFKKRLIETGTFNVQEIMNEKRIWAHNEMGIARPSGIVDNAVEKRKNHLKFVEKDNLTRLKANMTPNNASKIKVQKNESQVVQVAKNVSRTTGADGSDIDFSWIDDLEKRYNRERGQLGKKQDDERNYVENCQLRTVSPQMADDPTDQISLRPKYFGFSDDFSVNPNSQRLSLSYEAPFFTNVKEKLAVFEKEALRLRQEESKQRKSVAAQQNEKTSPSSNQIDAEPYIPKPDYDTDLKKHSENIESSRFKGFEKESKASSFIVGGRFMPDSYRHRMGALAPQYVGRNAFGACNGHG